MPINVYRLLDSINSYIILLIYIYHRFCDAFGKSLYIYITEMYICQKGLGNSNNVLLISTIYSTIVL